MNHPSSLEDLTVKNTTHPAASRGTPSMRAMSSVGSSVDTSAHGASKIDPASEGRTMTRTRTTSTDAPRTRRRSISTRGLSERVMPAGRPGFPFAAPSTPFAFGGIG